MTTSTKDTWQFWLMMASLIGGFVTGAIWLGSNSNQIAVNTKRMERMEVFMDEVREHDANTTARMTPIERRLDQLENWQQAMKRGSP
jgi:hypothetical protein